MQQVLDLYRRVLGEGSDRENRTGVDDMFVPGDMLKFDMADGFPIVTTRPSPFKSPIGEMICFI